MDNPAVKCGCLEHGFLRVRYVDCHAERLVAFGCERRGLYPRCGRAGWRKGPRCWWTKCYHANPYGKGC